MDMPIRPRRFSATFYPRDTGRSVTFDVTDEITMNGGVIPDADPRGTDVLAFSKNAPDYVKNFKGPFHIEVNEV